MKHQLTILSMGWAAFSHPIPANLHIDLTYQLTLKPPTYLADHSELAPTSTHQRTIHWMLVITQLWMKLN
jgi:hypothetical protein